MHNWPQKFSHNVKLCLCSEPYHIASVLFWGFIPPLPPPLLLLLLCTLYYLLRDSVYQAPHTRLLSGKKENLGYLQKFTLTWWEVGGRCNPTIESIIYTAGSIWRDQKRESKKQIIVQDLVLFVLTWKTLIGVDTSLNILGQSQETNLGDNFRIKLLKVQIILF